MPHPADIKAYPKLCASHYGVERKVLCQGGKNSLTWKHLFVYVVWLATMEYFEIPLLSTDKRFQFAKSLYNLFLCFVQIFFCYKNRNACERPRTKDDPWLATTLFIRCYLFFDEKYRKNIVSVPFVVRTLYRIKFIFFSNVPIKMHNDKTYWSVFY